MSSSNRRQRQGAQRYEPFGSQSFQVHDTSQAESTSFAVPEPVQGMQLMAGFQGQHDFPNTVQPSARESTLCPQLASLIHSLSPEQVTLMRELLHDQAVSSEMTRSNSYQTATSTTAEESSVPVSMWRGSIPHRPGVQGPIAFESVSGTDWTAQGHLQTPAAVEGDPALAGVPDRCNNGYDYNTMAVVALTSAQSVPDQNYQEVDNRESIQASSTYQNYPAEPGWWNGTTSQAVHDTAGGSATWLGSPVPAQASAVGVPQSSTYEGLGMTMQPPSSESRTAEARDRELGRGRSFKRSRKKARAGSSMSTSSPRPSIERPWQCGLCAAGVFSTKKDLVRHTKTHPEIGLDEKYICPTESCARVISRADNLKRHVREYHPTFYGREPVQCPRCKEYIYPGPDSHDVKSTD